jgi:hypothetical protein
VGRYPPETRYAASGEAKIACTAKEISLPRSRTPAWWRARFPGRPCGSCPERITCLGAAGQHILFGTGREQAYAKVRLGIDQLTFLIRGRHSMRS